MKNIHILTIVDTNQRYDTVGDYKVQKDESLLISVSKMSDSRFEFLIAIHELVESYLCDMRGITESSIDRFDFAYEDNRTEGDLLSQPGDDPQAPYYREHQFASKIERLMAKELNVDWSVYNEACAKLTQNS
ncbi:MAG: hypothetical protein AUK16_02535 [Parcubacteria group bacterium CG2_30_44_11]|nr:MAG: hypothetical protein AUK16_02535 [Parcubacteria group bacterium CG2_30_44_11]